MSKVQTVLDVGHAFAPGSKVEVHPRLLDTLDGKPVTKAVTSATVDKDGRVKLDGLEPHGPYFLTGEREVPVVKPGAQTPTSSEKVFHSVRFFGTAEQAPEETRHSQAQTQAEQRAFAEAQAKVHRSAPASAGSTGAINTATSNPPAVSDQETHDPDRAEAERRRAEAIRVAESHPAEAERLRKTADELDGTKKAKRKSGAAKRSSSKKGSRSRSKASSGAPRSKSKK